MFLLGQIGLVTLVVASAATALVPGPPGLIRRWTAITAAAGGGLTVLVLAVAFAAEDWRFAYTVGHARPGVAWPLRVAGLWAGPEGSLLLWTTLLAVATVVTTGFGASVWSSRLLASTTAAYGMVLLTVSYPLEQLPAPPGRGNGLQPVLEHPAMIWHPPILYLGLIALLVPAAWILGAGSDPERRTMPAASGPALALALALLTAGLATGANWAHVELGWGGYWAWDPIENAGLVAWLAAASMLHRFGPATNGDELEQPKSNMLWPAAAIGAAVIWATTITRTGVLSSVHAFADQPRLRAALLIIATLFTATVSAVAFLGHRSSVHSKDRQPNRSRSRIASVMVLVAAVVVAIGTYEPVVEVLVFDDPFTLSGRFYTLLLWPIAVVGAGARVWASVKVGAQVSSAPLAAAVVGAVVAMIVVGAAVGPFGLGLAAAGGAVATTSLVDGNGGRSRGWVTHLGIGLLLIGIAGTTATTRTTVVALIDQQAETPVGLVIHRGVELEGGPGTEEAVATLEVIDADAGNAADSRIFNPRLVRYRQTGGTSAEIDTQRGWLSDTQVVLLDADSERATYRISRHPRISLIWLGSGLTVVGLLVGAAGGRANDRRPESAKAPQSVR